MRKKRKGLSKNCIRMDEEDIPSEIRKDMLCIERTKLGFLCKVCNTHIELTTSDQISIKNLALHSQGKYHKYRLCTFKENLKCSQESFNKAPLLYQENDIILKTDLKLDAIVEQNELNVTWLKDSWFCQLCKINIPFSAQKKCRNNLASHFDSRSHQVKFKQEITIRPSKVSGGFIPPVYKLDLVGLQFQTMLKKKLNVDFVTKINEQYFTVKGNRYFCELCQLSILHRERGGLIEKHCKSHTHIRNLHTMAYKFLSGLNVSKVEKLFELDIDQADLFENELEDFLSESKDCFQCVAPSMKFVCLRGNRFLCLLCNMCMKKSQEGGHLKKHLASKTHKNLCYKLLCNHNNKPESSLKELSCLKPTLKNDIAQDNTQVHLKQQPLTKKKRSRKKKNPDNQIPLPNKIPEETSFLISTIENETEVCIKYISDKKYLKKCFKVNLEMNLNENYFELKDNQLHCEACRVQFECNTEISVLEQHCQSVNHNIKLSKIALDFVTKVNFKYCTSSESYKRFTTIMRGLTKTFPTIKATHHLEYIIHHNCYFICLLCSSSIRMYGVGLDLVHHLCSDSHKEKDYNLFCSSTRAIEKSFSAASNENEHSFWDSFGFPPKESNQVTFETDCSDSEVLDSWEDYLQIHSDEDVEDKENVGSYAGSEKTITDGLDFTFRAKESSQVVKSETLFKLEKPQELGQSDHPTKCNRICLHENVLGPREICNNRQFINNPVLAITAEKLDDIVKPEIISKPETIYNFKEKLTAIKTDIGSLGANLASSCEAFYKRGVPDDPVFIFTSEESTDKPQNSKEKVPSVDSIEGVFDKNHFSLFVSFDKNIANDRVFDCSSEEIKVKGGGTREFSTGQSYVGENKLLNLDHSVCLSPLKRLHSQSVDVQRKACLMENGSLTVDAATRRKFTTSTSNTAVIKNQLKSEEDASDQPKLSKSRLEASWGLLRQSTGTNLNSQYFCIKDNRIVCEVCQETIKLREDPVSNILLNQHCNSYRHNSVLESIAVDFVSDCSEIIQTSGSEEDWGEFKSVLAELQKTYPFTKFKHMLKYIWFKYDFLCCLLCQKQIHYQNNSKNVLSHFYTKIHKERSQQLAIKFVSKKNNFSQVSNEKNAMKRLLKSAPALHSQYFCIKGDNFFCKVCSKEIKHIEPLNSLDIHSSSSEHNNILEKIADDFVVLHEDKFRNTQSMANYDQFNSVLSEMQKHSTFSKVPYCLKYIGFRYDSFLCTLCDFIIPFTEDGFYVTGHMHGKLHRNKSLEIVLKHNSITQNSSKEENIVSENVYQNRAENDPEDNSTVLTSHSVQNVDEDSLKNTNTDNSLAEVTLERLLSRNTVTLLHSQYFCVKDDNFFCQVCSEEIKFTESVSLLDKHCKSLNHNKVLEDVANNFESIYSNSFPTSEFETKCDRFKYALSQLKNQHPFSKFKYFLKYISFNAHTFFCFLCDKTLPSEKPIRSITRHVSTCKTHKTKSLELALNYVSATNCNSDGHKVALSDNFQQDNFENSISRSPKNIADPKHVFNMSKLEEEALLKPILKTSTMTSLHSQFFHTEGNSFFCLVCSIEVDKQVTSLSAHCESLEHNTILKKVAIDYVSIYGEHFQKFQHEKSCDKFKEVISEVKMQYPFFGFDHFLWYFAFNFESFICILCDRSFPFSTNGKCIYNHILNCQLHKRRSVELVLKQTSVGTNNSLGEIALSSQSFHQVENNEDKVTEKVGPSLQNTTEEENVDHFFTEKLQIRLKCLLKKNTVTALHSQYFCTKGNAFFCQVCSKEIIEFTNDVKSLEFHCKSSDHNHALENITSNYVSCHGGMLQSNDREENGDKFKQVICDLERKYPCCKFKYFLKFITFDSDSFICILCDMPLAYTEDGRCVFGHLHCKLHREKSLELVLKHNSRNEVKRSTEVPLQQEISSQCTDSKVLKNQSLSSIVSSLSNDLNKDLIFFEETANCTQEFQTGNHEKCGTIISNELILGEVNSDPNTECDLKIANFNHLTSQSNNDEMPNVSESKSGHLGDKQSNNMTPSEHSFSNIHEVDESHLLEIKPDVFKVEAQNCHTSDTLEGKEETSDGEKIRLAQISPTERSSTDSFVQTDQSTCSQFTTESDTVSLNTFNLTHGVFEVSENRLICTICNCSLGSSSGQLPANKIIQTHVSSPEHKEHESAYRCIKNTSLSSLIKSKISMIFADNRHIIERRGHFFHCMACNMDFPNLNDDMLSHLNFALHFEYHQEFHRNIPLDLPQYSVQPESQLSQIEPENIISQVQPENNLSQIQPENNLSQIQPENNLSQIQPGNNLSQIQPGNNPSHPGLFETQQKINFQSDLGNHNKIDLGSVELKVDQMKSEDKTCLSGFKSKNGTLICPECEESFEIYNNNNLEFSLQHHIQKHKTLTEVNEMADSEELLERLGTQKSFIEIKDSDFFCNLCRCRVISKLDKGLALQYLQEHIKEPYHLNQYELFLEETSGPSYPNEPVTKTFQLNPEVFKALFDNANSSIVKENRRFIKIKGNLLHCTLCSVSIDFSPAHQTNVSNLKTHFKSNCHTMNSYMDSTWSCSSVGTAVQTAKKPEKDNFRSLLGWTEDRTVKENEKFIKLKGNLIYCTVCKTSMTLSPNPQCNLNNWKLHITGYNHTQSLKLSKSPSKPVNPTVKTVSPEKDKLKNVIGQIYSDVVQKNKHFIKVRANKFFCTACSISMNISQSHQVNIKNLEVHLNGFYHNEKSK